MSDTVNQLQLLQKNMESLMEQKHEMQEHLFELDSAMQSLPESKQSYKIVGKLLIAKDASELQVELKEEKKQFELQMKEIETQEIAIKDKMQSLQKKLLETTK